MPVGLGPRNVSATHRAGLPRPRFGSTSHAKASSPSPNLRRVLDDDGFQRWTVAAADALAGARLLADAGLHQWACFLAEQSAQLAVKGLLHGMGAGAWGHDLVELGRAWTEATGDEMAATTASALRRLSRHYIPARYPDAHPAGTPGMHYGADDSAQALADAAAVSGAVAGTWGTLQDDGEDH